MIMASTWAVSCSLVILAVTIVQAEPPETAQVSFGSLAALFDFHFVGCLRLEAFSTNDNDLFTPVEDWEFMSINQCISNCHHAAYAAVNNQTCYCSSSPSALSVEIMEDSACNIPCPGNAQQACGGASSLSVYQNTQYTAPDPLVSSDLEANVPEHHFDLVRPRAISMVNSPASATVNMPQQTIFPIPISTTYTDICGPPLCASAYPSEHATTITALVTRTWPESVPSVPMRTKHVKYTSTDDEGQVQAVETTVAVPDEEGIQEMEEEVQSWRREWEDHNGAVREEGLEQVLGAKGDDQSSEENVDGLDAMELQHVDVGEDAGNEDGDAGASDSAQDSNSENPVSAIELDPTPVEEIAGSIERRDDSVVHAGYQANDHETPFAGVGGLGNVQVMPAQRHWE